MNRLALCIAVGLLVIGCAARPPQQPETTPVTAIPKVGNWFCQMSPSGDGWECVQDPAQADNPRPQRLPPAARLPDRPTPVPATPVPVAPAAPAAEPDLQAPSAEPDNEPRAPRASDPSPPPPTGLPAREAAADAPVSRQSDNPRREPEYVRLAYQPPEPVALTELPEDFYAIQVLAMSSKDALEAFVARSGLTGMSAARVESDGHLYYVLLLGIYESRSAADRAAAQMPAPFDRDTPWVRSVGSIQAAMVRADTLAGSTRF